MKAIIWVGEKLSLLLSTLVLIASIAPGRAHAAAWDGSAAEITNREMIVGGVTVAPSDVIASTTVAIVSQTSEGTALCTGSILDTDLIVTAGHCVGPSPSQMLVVFRKDLSDKSGPVVKVAGYIRDPNYGNGTNDKDNDDIALIRFDGGLPAGYQPAQLLQDSSALQNGETVTLAGYGITDGSASARDDGTDDGAGVLRKVDTTIANAHYGQTEVEVDQTLGKGACHGDSGGPAFLMSADGSLLLFGVTSRGPSNQPDDCASYGIYTNILAHLDFIQQATQALRAGQSD
jgi:secreted trypsin-like serine protease